MDETTSCSGPSTSTTSRRAGATADDAAYMALLGPGDTIMGTTHPTTVAI